MQAEIHATTWIKQIIIGELSLENENFQLNYYNRQNVFDALPGISLDEFENCFFHHIAQTFAHWLLQNGTYIHMAALNSTIETTESINDQRNNQTDWQLKWNDEWKTRNIIIIKMMPCIFLKMTRQNTGLTSWTF